MIRTEIPIDVECESSFRRYVKTLARRDKIIGSYACLDHMRIAPLLEQYLALPGGRKSLEHPRMINLLIDTFPYESERKRTSALGSEIPNLETFLITEARAKLPKLCSLKELVLILESEHAHELIPGIFIRIVSLALAKYFGKVLSLEEAFAYAENYYQADLKHKDAFLTLVREPLEFSN